MDHVEDSRANAAGLSSPAFSRMKTIINDIVARVLDNCQTQDNIAAQLDIWSRAMQAHPTSRGEVGSAYATWFEICPTCAMTRSRVSQGRRETGDRFRPYMFTLRCEVESQLALWTCQVPPSENDASAAAQEYRNTGYVIAGAQDTSHGRFREGYLKAPQYAMRGQMTAAVIAQTGATWGFDAKLRPMQLQTKKPQQRKPSACMTASHQAAADKGKKRAAEQPESGAAKQECIVHSGGAVVECGVCSIRWCSASPDGITLTQSAKEPDDRNRCLECSMDNIIAVELDDGISRGAFEGPISYTGGVVTRQFIDWREATRINAQGQLETYMKPRLVTDCKASGYNAGCPPSTASYARVDDAIALMTPGCWQVKGDQPKAFTRKPVYWRDADAVIVQHPITKKHYRHRYMVFGMSRGPEYQTVESDAQVAMRAAGYAGEEFETPEGWDESRDELTDLPTFPPSSKKHRWVCLMDDFYTTALSKDEAEAEYSRMEALQGITGSTLAPAKKEVEQKLDFAGVELDAVQQVGRMPKLKLLKYKKAIEDLITSVEKTGTISRDSCSRVVGQMNFAAEWLGLEPYLLECIYVLWPPETYGEMDDREVVTTDSLPGTKTQPRWIAGNPSGQQSRKHMSVYLRPRVMAEWNGAEELPVTAEALANFHFWAKHMESRNETGTRLYLDKSPPGRWTGGRLAQSPDSLGYPQKGQSASGCVDHSCWRTPTEQIRFYSSDAAAEMGAAKMGRESFSVKLTTKVDGSSENHIMHPELMAAIEAVIMFEELHPIGDEDRVLGLCDNESDVYAWNKGWGKNKRLIEMIRSYREKLRKLGVNLKLTYINTHWNPADYFTRKPFPSPFTESTRLVESVYKELQAATGFTMEAYGSKRNSRCAKHCSANEPFENAWPQDETVFVNAPFSMILEAAQTLQSLRAAGCKFRFVFLVPTGSPGIATCVKQVTDILRSMGATPSVTYEAGESIFENRKIRFEEDDMTPAHVALPPLRWRVDAWTHLG